MLATYGPFSTWAKCDAFKKHQEYLLEVRIFHPVALAGFQIVSIHLAVELDWAHGIKTILRSDLFLINPWPFELAQ